MAIYHNTSKHILTVNMSTSPVLHHQVELDRLTENKAQLISRLEQAERELDRCARKNDGWSKLWEEKVELIRKLEQQVRG